MQAVLLTVHLLLALALILVVLLQRSEGGGLGIGGGTLGPAWQGGGGTVRLPVYDRWEFTTAPDGDFARLARRLQGVPAPWRVGRRIMDTARPGAPLTDLSVDDFSTPLQLLARELGFTDPLDGRPLHFVSPRRLQVPD